MATETQVGDVLAVFGVTPRAGTQAASCVDLLCIWTTPAA
jgi:hypothetical protein